jgi:hypothetical protein
MSDDIRIAINKPEITSGEEIHGTILLNYNGRFDSLVINSLIENYSDTVSIELINKKRVNCPYSRLSMLKSDIGDTNIIEFVARTNHLPKDTPSSIKFRASLIQEHKEIASSVTYLKVMN